MVHVGQPDITKQEQEIVLSQGFDSDLPPHPIDLVLTEAAHLKQHAQRIADELNSPPKRIRLRSADRSGELPGPGDEDYYPLP